jgi:hypothetical protein
LKVGPPGHFVALTVKLMMVLAAQWDGEFIAYLSSQRLGLGKLNMVGVTRHALADYARLGRNKAKMDLASVTIRFRQWEYVVNSSCGRVGCFRCCGIRFCLMILRDLHLAAHRSTIQGIE